MTKSLILRYATAALLPLAVSGCSAPFVGTAQKPVLANEASIRAEAARSAPPAWKLPLGSGHIDDMAVPTPGRLLMTVRKAATRTGGQHMMLVDMASGKTIWRYDGKQNKAEYRQILALSDIILYRLDREDGEGATLVALDAANGAERWTLKVDGGAVTFQPLLVDGLILAVRRDKEDITATAYKLSSAKKGWERKFALPAGDTGTPPAPLTTVDGMWVFYGGVEKIATDTGETVWSRDDLLPGSWASPRLAGNSLYLMDKGKALHKLAAASGKSLWRSAAPVGGATVTNIYPSGERIYLRGMNPADLKAAKPLVAVGARDGKRLWRHDNNGFVVSNFIEHNGRLYFATPSHLAALDLASGRLAFSTEITNSGRAFPVQVRRFGNKMVFLGELIVAAVDAKSGRIGYSHGFDPVDDFTSLNNIDSTISNNSGRSAGSANAFADMAATSAANSARYQEQSNHYANVASQARTQAARGDSMAGIRAQGAQAQADINAEFSRIESNMALMSSSMALGQALAEARWNANFAAEVRRQEYLRRVITSSYPIMEQGEYVYRPMRDIRSRTEQFAGVAVIHMPTGRIAQTNLSAQHFIYGLWNLVDIEKGLVYHNGVGLDPAAYEYDGKSGHFPVDYVNTFLIARPVKIPR
jgi:outer membrane protein assembly factor BamB